MNTSLNNTPMSASFFVAVCFVMMLSLSSINAWASTTVSERVDFSRAMPEENVEDMSVKVLGGSISVNRFYRVMKRNVNESGYPGVSGDLQGYKGNSLVSEATQFAGGGADRKDFGVWQFHRKWHDLLFVESNVSFSTSGSSSSAGSTVTAPSEGGATLGDQSAPSYIDRNDYLYELQRGENYYVYEHNGNDLRITITDTGFRWSNRQGDWIDYDEKGLALRSGDKNGVSINLVRQNGFISEYKDHLGRTVVTWEYQNKKPVKVTDYGGRVVEYKWDNHDLIEVITARGHKWKYGYEQIGDNRVMTTKTDPLNQVFTYEFEQTAGGYQTNSASGSGNANVTLIGDDTPVAISSGSSAGNAGGSVTGFSVPVEPTLMHTSMIYPDGKRIRYQYRYDPASESYMVLTINSDGLEEENWYDLDGNIRYQLNGGRVAGTRVRLDRTAVSRDAYNNKTVTKFTRFNAVESITYADGTQVKYEYLPHYNLPILFTDQLGVKTKYEYDGSGNLIRLIKGFSGKDPRITEYRYDQLGQLILKKLIGVSAGEDTPHDVEVKFEYDDYGNITKYTDGNSNIRVFNRYDSNGRAQEIVNERGFAQTYKYDYDGNLESTVTPLDYKYSYEYDVLGRLSKEIDPTNRTKRFEYDSRNNMVKEVDDLGGEKQSRYRLDGQLLWFKDQVGLETSFKYDRAGRLLEKTDGVGNKTITRYVKHDELSGLLIESIQTPDVFTTIKYDDLNRVVSRSQLSSKSDSVTSTYNRIYTLRGKVKEDTDPNGNRVRYEYNDHSEIAKIIDSIGGEISFKYDFRGNIVNVNDALGHDISYEYDSNNNKLSETRPRKETHLETFKKLYSYDEVNNLSRVIDFKGNMTDHEYDANNRKIKTTDTLWSEPIKDGSKAARIIKYGYDNSGLLISYHDGFLTIGYEHDLLGRLIEQSSTFNAISGLENSMGFTKVLKTRYYANGNIKESIDAEGNSTTYYYDDADRVSKVSVQNAGSVVYNEYLGTRPSKITYPGGVTRELGYDGLSRINRIFVSDNAQNAISDIYYSFDAKGNVVAKNNSLSIERDFHYEYDKLDRLVSANQPNGFGFQEYNYDANGNRTSKTTDNDGESISQNYLYSEDQEFLGINESVSNTYDANGALLASSSLNTNLEYSSFGQLVLFTVDNGGVLSNTRYQYDGMNRRIVKQSENQTTVFLYNDLDQGLYAEYNERGDLVRSYGYLPGSEPTANPVFMKYEQSGLKEFAFYQNDALGTPQKLIKNNGKVVWQAKYDAFGKVDTSSSLLDQPLRFPGQYHDHESGYYYNWNRYYDPEIGRYIARDPIGLEGGMNNYLYAEASPIVRYDATGLSSKVRETGPEKRAKYEEKKRRQPSPNYVVPRYKPLGEPVVKTPGKPPSTGPQKGPAAGADDKAEILGLLGCAVISASQIAIKRGAVEVRLENYERSLEPCIAGCTRFCVEYKRQYGHGSPWCISDIYGDAATTCDEIDFIRADNGGNRKFYKTACKDTRVIGVGPCC